MKWLERHVARKMAQAKVPTRVSLLFGHILRWELVQGRLPHSSVEREICLSLSLFGVNWCQWEGK